MIMLIQYAPLIVGVFMLRKYRLNPITFYTMYIISVCGWGFYYNNLFRFGIIFPSDLYMVAFIFAFFIHNKFKIKTDRKTFTFIVSIVLFQLFLSFIYNYQFRYIFVDFKYVLYFFVPYFYSKEIWRDKQKMKDCFYVYIFCVVMSLALNWIQFFSTGLININSGGDEIVRTFGVGLGFSCGYLCSGLLIIYKDRFINKYSIVSYYIIQTILILSCFASYTRTSWISYFIILILVIVLVQKRKLNSNEVFKYLRNFVIIALLGWIIYSYFKLNFPEIINSLTKRLDSLSEATTDKDNTLFSRFNSILSGIEVFYSPQIICGYGFGSLYKNAFGNYYNGLENSYIYYMWKYGIVAATYLFYRVYNRIKRMWKSESNANRVYVVCFVVSSMIGSMSGNMNSTYTLGAISIILGINFGLIFDDII